jgi:hypothetical protein
VAVEVEVDKEEVEAVAAEVVAVADRRAYLAKPGRPRAMEPRLSPRKYSRCLRSKGDHMATLPKNTPIFSDQLTAWHNQRLWWLLCGAGGVIAVLTVAQFPEEQASLSKAYAMTTGQATQALTAYCHADKGSNPLEANGKYWQGVRVVRTLKLPTNNSYQVDYTTLRYDHHDHQLNPIETNWRATLHLVQGKPTTNNTLGLYIDNLDMAPEAK